MTGNTSPEELVGRIRMRDHRAFHQLIDMFDARLRVLVVRIVRSNADVDDVLQDTYLGLYQQIVKGAEFENIGGYLYRLAYNRAIDSLRRNSRTNGSSWIEAAHSGPNAALTIDLDRALMQLTVDQRAVVILVDREGFDYQSAAQIIGVASGTIASRLSTARKALRHLLDDYSGETK